MNTITHYLCPQCIALNPIIADLQTGLFLQYSGQLVHHGRHSSTQPQKPTGSYFLDTSLGSYESGAHWFGSHAWAGFEPGGSMVLLAVFQSPIAIIEHFGVGAVPTTTGMLVLPHIPAHRHYFGIGQINGAAPICASCCSGWS